MNNGHARSKKNHGWRAVWVTTGIRMMQQVRHAPAKITIPCAMPKQIFSTDAIPRTATGKIQRRVVAQAFSAQPS